MGGELGAGRARATEQVQRGTVRPVPNVTGICPHAFAAQRGRLDLLSTDLEHYTAAGVRDLALHLFAQKAHKRRQHMQVRNRHVKTGTAPLHTPTDLKRNAVRDLSGVLNILLADMFALYLKTKKLSLAYIWSAFSRLSSSAG
jgi:hypothetical protein